MWHALWLQLLAPEACVTQAMAMTSTVTRNSALMAWSSMPVGACDLREMLTSGWK